MSWMVYMLRCADDTLYTGVCTDLDRRLKEHNQTKRGARYTRSRRPVSLLAFKPFPDRSAACREESRLKKLTRKRKLNWVQMMREAI